MMDIFRELDESYAEGLTQPYPTFIPRTIFKSFDYVGKPFADILDSIAIIIIVWSASSIFLTCFFNIQGKSTRSMAVKDAVDRAVNVSIAPCFSFQKDTALQMRPRIFSNDFLKTPAALAVFGLFGIQALIIYSQAFSSHSRGLSELGLKRILLETHSHTSIQKSGFKIGCKLLVRNQNSQDSIPFYLCERVELSNTPLSFVEKNRSEILFRTYQDRFFLVDVPHPQGNLSVRLIFSVSFELRNVHDLSIFYANLTKWKFHLRVETLNWMTSKINKDFPLSNAKVIRRNDNLYGISLLHGHWSMNVSVFAWLTVLGMIRISDSLMQATDFIPPKNLFASKVSTQPAGITTTNVKRLSGLTLWLIAAILEILRLVLGILSRDITEEMDEMVAKALDMESVEFLRNSPNILLQIVSRESSLSYNFDEKDESVPQGSRLFLQMKERNVDSYSPRRAKSLCC